MITTTQQTRIKMMGQSTKQFALINEKGTEILRLDGNEISIDAGGFIGGFRGQDDNRELAFVINLAMGHSIKEVTNDIHQPPPPS